MTRRPLLRRLATAAIAAGLLASLAAPSPASAQAARPLRIAVEGAYPPFSEVAPDGSLHGFDIDIARALCAQMKADCVLVQQAWDGMIPGLNARKFDAVISSMSITDERRRVVAFTHRYYSTPARLVGRLSAGLQATPAGMKGKRIGVQRATSHERFVTDYFKDSEIVRYGSQEEVFLDLAAGRLDAAFGDSVAADMGFLKRPAARGFGFVGPVFDDTRYFGYGAGIALRKADTDLLQRFDQAIAAIRADGRYQQIQARYFSFDVYGSDR